MRRREFITLIGGAAATWSSAAGAQQLTDRTAKIGLLTTPLADPVMARGYPAFLDELKKSGFSEGQNLTVETVRLDQDAQRLFADTADLVRSNVELLVANRDRNGAESSHCGEPNYSGCHLGPITTDPIAHGYVKSLARPGGNVTGIVSLQTELAAKQVELLTQAVAGRTRRGGSYDENSADQFAAADRQAKLLAWTSNR